MNTAVPALKLALSKASDQDIHDLFGDLGIRDLQPSGSATRAQLERALIDWSFAVPNLREERPHKIIALVAYKVAEGRAKEELQGYYNKMGLRDVKNLFLDFNILELQPGGHASRYHLEKAFTAWVMEDLATRIVLVRDYIG